MTVRELQKTLALHKKVVPKKTTLPILQSVQIVADSNTIKIQSTDLEKSLETRLTQTMPMSFTKIVELHHLLNVLETLDKKSECTFRIVGKDILAVYGGDETVTLAPAHPDEEFPALELADGNIQVNQVNQEFIRHLVNAEKFCSIDTLRPCLNGVCVEKDGTIVSTDGTILYWTRPLQLKPKLKDAIIIPSHAIEIIKQFSDAKLGTQIRETRDGKKITISLSDGEKNFCCQAVNHFSKRKKGGFEEFDHFPKWRHIVPSGDFTEVTINPTELKATAEKMVKLSPQRGRWETPHYFRCLFNFGQDGATISYADKKAPDYKQQIFSIRTETPFKVVLDGDRVKDVMSVFDTEVTLKFSDWKTALLFENRDASVLLMPVNPDPYAIDEEEPAEQTPQASVPKFLSPFSPD